MRKSLPIIVLFLIGIVVNLSALEPIRVSVVTTPFTSKTVFIDILLSDGTSSGISTITKPALSTDGAGVLSFVLNESDWTTLDIATVRNHIVQISYAPTEGSSTIISLQRLEDVIANQGLLGAFVDSDEMNQDSTYDFGDIRALEMVLKDDGLEGAVQGNILNTITFDAPDDVTEDYILTFPTAKPTVNSSILMANTDGVLTWSDSPTGSLQSSYDGGREISATDGPVRILNANTENGGLDVYASGAAGDAIDARLDGTLGATQTAVQGVYNLEFPIGEDEGTTTVSHSGYLGGSFSMDGGEEEEDMVIIAGVAGTSFNEFEGGPVGALGVTIPDFYDGEVGQFAALLFGDVFMAMGSFVEDTYFDKTVYFNYADGDNYFSMPPTRGSAGQVLTSNGAGATSWDDAGSGWSLSGNNVADDGSNFLGTTDNQPLIFKVNNTEAGRITNSGGNTSLGYSALISTTNIANTAMGFESMKANTTGAYNTAYGSGSLTANKGGDQNTAIGYNTLYTNNSGYYNTALGSGAMYANTSGHTNTALGVQAGYKISNGSDDNLASNTSVYLGAFSKAGASGNTNEIVIGHEAIGNGSNSITLGNTAIEKTVTRGNVILSNSAGNVVANAVTVPPYVSVYYITSDSDETDDIITLPAGINGQMLYLTVYDGGDMTDEDCDDVMLDIDGTSNYILISRELNNYLGITLIYSNGGWRVVGVHTYNVETP
jgi:hypothetical protein